DPKTLEQVGYDPTLLPSNYYSLNTAIAVDLTHITYNQSSTTPGCYKNDVTLTYGTAPAGQVSPSPALSFNVLGNVVLARQHKLDSIVVSSRADCAGQLTTLRQYDLAYQDDPDTRLERLSSVSVRGRSGTLEYSTPLPVARYAYGSATTPATGTDRV